LFGDDVDDCGGGFLKKINKKILIPKTRINMATPIKNGLMCIYS